MGDEVPARMEPITGGVRSVIDDSGAAYPLSVDPLAMSPSWTAVGEGTDNSLAVAWRRRGTSMGTAIRMS
jgi:hypothetical protein